MAALSLSPLGPVTLGSPTALRPAQPLPIQEGKTSGSSTLAIQDLAQGLFQRALQTSILSLVSEPGGGHIRFAQEATAALLASLAAPQAPASATPATYATPLAITQTAPSTALGATPPAAVIADTPATQDAFASSSTMEFAMQAALRFGAGVAGQGTLALPSADLGTGLIRDAAAVPRLGNLQAQAGAPGPEAFALPQASTSRFLRSYEATPIPAINAEASRVDVFA